MLSLSKRRNYGNNDYSKALNKKSVLANIAVNKNDLFITPLLSGKHGIGKSQMIKSIAKDLGGVCMTIEGGTLDLTIMCEEEFMNKYELDVLYYENV